ncbi:hypothetical protein Aduo_015924 [Ancylostoma duodenale]
MEDLPTTYFPAHYFSTGKVGQYILQKVTATNSWPGHLASDAVCWAQSCRGPRESEWTEGNKAVAIECCGENDRQLVEIVATTSAKNKRVETGAVHPKQKIFCPGIPNKGIQRNVPAQYNCLLPVRRNVGTASSKTSTESRVIASSRPRVRNRFLFQRTDDWHFYIWITRAANE